MVKTVRAVKLDSKRISIVVPYYIGGGAEKVTDMLFGELMHRHGYNVQLISVKMTDHTRRRARELGYEVEELTGVGNDINSPEASEAVLQKLKQSAARNIVYVGVTPEQIARYRLELPGRNIIFHLHTMPLWEARIRHLGAKQTAIAWNSLSRYLKWSLLQYPKEAWFKRYTRRYGRRYRHIYDNVDRIVVLTDSYRRQINRLLNMSPESTDSKVSTLYNPFCPKASRPTAKAKEVLYAGRFNCLEKGTDTLLRAWAMIWRKHPAWRLKLLGNGPDKGYLEHIIAALGIENVDFCEYTPDPSGYYESASLLCLPSNVEGWPMVLLEAMDAGVVPVAFDCSGGVREILADKRGELAPHGNTKALSRTLSKLMDRPEELASYRRRYPDYLQQFSLERAVTDFTKLLAQ